MSIRYPWLRGLLLALAMSPLALTFTSAAEPLRASDDPAKVLRFQAEQYEKAGDWGAAADKYEELLRLDRSQTAVRERYHYCVRRFLQIVRFRDPSYRKEVLSLKYPQAVRLYEIVLYNLLNHTLDKNKVSAGLLFRKGLEEFRFALASPEFCFDHLGGLKADQTRALRNLLQTHYSGHKTMTYEEVVETVREVVMKSTNHFPNINPTTVVMEFLCGSCVAMDDYTAYLTPRQLRELCATLKGQHVGVGLRLKMHDSKVVIAEVLAGSPAATANPPLAAGEHIVSINKTATYQLTPEDVTELLEGEEGSTVEIVVASPSQGQRVVMLARQALYVSSVDHETFDHIGYLRINFFQETTLAEFDAAVAELMKADCKALVLDLRGNPGGLLNVSIDIARRFLEKGLILSTQHQDSKSSKEFHSNNPLALTWPVVVLVDSDTASAAEVLAGALKENGRARIVGQTTYGKGCSQGLLKLPGEGELLFPATTSAGGGTGGIRITIARFFSPSGQPYCGRGVEPDVPAQGEMQIYQARDEAQKLIGMQ